VFRRARVVVFADGDFWHGRDLTSRLAKSSLRWGGPYSDSGRRRSNAMSIAS
jgi:hypothetical protein